MAVTAATVEEVCKRAGIELPPELLGNIVA